MFAAKVSRKGRITLRENVCRELGIKPGDMLEEEVEDGMIILMNLIELHPKTITSWIDSGLP
jgi:AbrB family looped-hinge helix DNA binding protein